MSLNPEYRIASASELAAWLSTTYARAHTGPVELQREGYPALYRIDARSEPLWLRVYSRGHPAFARLRAQAEALAGLGRSANIVHPVAGSDGHFVQFVNVGHERRHAIVFTHAAGKAIDRRNPADLAALGSALAQLHGVTPLVPDAGIGTIDFESLVEAPLRRLASHAAAAPAIEAARLLADHLKPWSSLPCGVCHGDVHVDNGNITDDGTVTLFDFDELAWGPFAYDLACCWRKLALEHHDGSTIDDAWHAFLAGYESIRMLDEAEQRAVPALATLRAIWTMAMPARDVAIWGRDWLADPGYFAAHLAMIERFAAEATACP